MIAADLLRVVVQAATATLLITGTAQVWMLAALSFAYGLSAASFMPAFMGLIPQVVAPARLQEANALIALTRSLANVAGPAIAGAIIAISGPGEAIAVDAATFVISAACLLRCAWSPRARPRGGPGATPASSTSCARGGTR